MEFPPLLPTNQGQGTDTTGSGRRERWFYFIVFLYVCFLATDGILGYILFDVYPKIYAQYLNQSTALVYCIWSTIGVIYLQRKARVAEDNATPPLQTTAAVVAENDGKSHSPWYYLVAIGALNGTANFFQAVGMPNTAGLSQSLLPLLSLPVVLVLSYFFLRRTPTSKSLAGAFLILLGCVLSGLRDVLNPNEHSSGGGAHPVYWYSTLFFIVAQLFLGTERVYEDYIFSRYKALHPMKMFCWTMYVQFFLYIFFLPSQTLSIFGGLDITEIPGVMRDGVRCTLGQGDSCDWKNTALFLSYCCVDFWCYFLGLYIISNFGAPAMAVASAVTIPIQQFVFCMPFLVGGFADSFYLSDLFALVVCVGGYFVFQRNEAKD